ncbi:MAG TPA: hypothetical protein VK211_15135 [Kamptonema sp.]|nr:hypothetical protein [Kamptonema sp.]
MKILPDSKPKTSCLKRIFQAILFATLLFWAEPATVDRPQSAIASCVPQQTPTGKTCRPN